MIKSKTVTLVALLLFCAVVHQAHAATWIVDPSGSGNFTSLLALKGPTVKPGDLVYVRGTFTTMQTLENLNGTKENPITVTSYPGTTAIFDGTGATLASYQGMVRLNLCNNIIVDGILVRDSSQAGISFYYSNNIVVKNTVVHDTYVRGIGGCGNNVMISNNTVYNACMQNVNAGSSSWSQAVSSSRCSDSDNLKNWVFEYNKVYNSWGEGIDCIQVDGCIVRHNVVYDTFSVNIYMDNANGILVDSNLIYSVSSSYYRYDRPAIGILVGAETWPAVPQPTFDVVIRNNLLVRTSGISNFRAGSNYVTKVSILYNTVWNPNSTYPPFYWPGQPITPSGNVLKNNLFWGKDDSSCSIGTQRSAWSMSNNVWVGAKSVPKNCTGSGSRAVNESRIHFASGGLNNRPGVPIPTDFLLEESSPARGAAVPLSSVTRDYYGYPRDSERPSAGFVEYGTDPNYNGGASSASAFSSSLVALLGSAARLLRLC